MTKWEYKTLEGSYPAPWNYDKLGNEGWELVAVLKRAEFQYQTFFKRPKESA